MASPDAPRTRDAERSKTAILDAAEQLFAAHGYQGSSLQDIGAAAGVSRGTPSYFFGSKEGLYRAVLERNFTRVGEKLRQARAEATARGDHPESVLASKVEIFIDFLIEHPTFVRLVQWEAVNGGDVLSDLSEHLKVIMESLTMVSEELGRGAFRPVDPLHLMISLTAMCWYPFANSDTYMRALDKDPRDPEFVAERKRHIVDLVLNGIRPR